MRASRGLKWENKMHKLKKSIPGVGLSPTQLLMGRRTRSIIPIKSTLLTPMTYNTKEVQSALTARQQTQKEYFDRSSKEKQERHSQDTRNITLRASRLS